MSCFIIYKTTCLVNQKIYVGQHNTSAIDGYLGTGKIIKLAIKKHGRHNFKRETLEFCTSANVNEKEVYWVDRLDSTNPEIGYNITKGGDGVIIVGRNNPMLGRKQSKKSRKLMSLNHQDFNGKRNPRFGKGKYLYTFSSNEETIQTKSLVEFCRNNNLNLNMLNWCFRVGQKLHKGWRLKRDLLTS